jgi:periplasmic protein CpxP/Spy
MDKLKFVTAIAVVLLITNLGLVGFLFLHGQRNMHPPRPDQIIIERLQLTPSQKEQFYQLRDEHHSGVVRYRDSIRLIKKEIINGLKNEQPDRAAMEADIEKISRLQQKIEGITFDHFASLRQICDVKQKILFDEFIEEIAQSIDRPGGPPPGGRP